MNDDERAIRTLVDDWMKAAATGDDARVLELMDEDVVFLTAGNPPLRTRAAFAAAQKETGRFRIDGQADVREVHVNGDWADAWNHLTVAMTPLDGGETSRRAGDVLSVFRKHDGRWPLFRELNLLAPLKKRRLMSRMLLICVGLLTMADARVAMAAAADSLSSLRGRVVRAEDGAPLGWASVIVPGSRRGTFADEEGRFEITGVPPGRWTLRVQSPGVLPLSRPIEFPAGDFDLGEIAVASLEGTPAVVQIDERVPYREGDLRADIRLTAPVVRVGGGVSFDVRVRNRGSSPVSLVRSVDGSDVGSSPEVSVKIEGPEGGFGVRDVRFCGNWGGVGPEDVVEVPPGAEFDPYADGWPDLSLRSGSFALPGRYTATFRYSTMDADPRSWASGPAIRTNERYDSVRALIRRVPPVELTARVAFTVLPRQ